MTTPKGSSGTVQLAARLREERRRIGLSQAAMAEALKTSLSSQKRYENDERKPDADYLMALEKLGIDTAFILTGERKSSQPLDLSGLGEHISPEAIADKVLAHGDKRSQEYRLGIVDVLRFRLDGKRIHCPYAAGTPQFDAYFAGNDRGHFQWRLMVDGAWKPN